MNTVDLKRIAFNISFDKYRNSFKFNSINYKFDNDDYIEIVVSFDNKDDVSRLIEMFDQYDRVTCCTSDVKSYISFQENIPIVREQGGMVAHIHAENFGGEPVYMMKINLSRSKYDYQMIELLSGCVL